MDHSAGSGHVSLTKKWRENLMAAKVLGRMIRILGGTSGATGLSPRFAANLPSWLHCEMLLRTCTTEN
jgi:hypothetical protein